MQETVGTGSQGDKRTYWQSMIASWKNSGKSKQKFCDENTLNIHRFGYWLRKE